MNKQAGDEELPELHPSLQEAVAAKNMDIAGLSLGFAIDDRDRLSITDRHSVPVTDPESKVVHWRVPALRDLFRGNATPPEDIDRYPPEYVPYFAFVEVKLLDVFDIEGDKTDQEMEKIFGSLRRRPDGRSLGAVHDAIWQVAALLLGTHPLSEAQFSAIFGQLERSARKWSINPVSRNYASFLRNILQR